MVSSDGPIEAHSAARLIRTRPEVVYAALVDPEMLVRWLPPEGAAGRVVALEPWPGGRFAMVLTFEQASGKSSGDSDVVEGRFVELAAGSMVVLAVEFASDRPEFAGVMTLTWSLQPQAGGTHVTVTAQNAPAGIARPDHERGMASSLANLARLVE